MRKNFHVAMGLLLSLAGSAALAGTIGGPVDFTTDAGTNVNSSLTYTHVLDFGPPDATKSPDPASINGVQFTDAAASGPNWSLTNDANMVGTIPYSSRDGGGLSLANSVPSGSGSYSMLADFFYYGATATNGNFETLTLSGLTPGTEYEATMFYRAWDSGTDRTNTLKFDEGTPGLAQSINVNQNANLKNADYVTYDYIAGAAGTLTITETVNNPNGDSWHNYGITNAIVPVPEPASLVLFVLGAVGLFVAVRRRKS
jgi:hypothetical protein